MLILFFSYIFIYQIYFNYLVEGFTLTQADIDSINTNLKDLKTQVDVITRDPTLLNKINTLNQNVLDVKNDITNNINPAIQKFLVLEPVITDILEQSETLDIMADINSNDDTLV
jgi:uncharacterized protein YoxC